MAIAGIVLVVANDALVADGTSSTTITASLITTAGTPAPDGVTVTFMTDKGRFSTDGSKTASASTIGGNGMVLMPFISEPGVVGTANIVVSVGAITQSIQVALIPSIGGPGISGSIVGIRLSAGSNALVANGTNLTTITAALVTTAGTHP